MAVTARTAATRRLTPGLLVLLGAFMTVNPLTASTYLPALGNLVADLGATLAGGQLVYAGFLIGVAGGQLLVGPISDAYGRRVVLLGGLGILAVTGVAATLAPSIELLVSARVAQGLGTAGVVVVSRAVVADTAQGKAAARAYSILMGIVAAGPFAAPLLGTLALDLGGWRAVFVLLTVLSVVAFVVAWLAVPETLTRERRSALRFTTVAGNSLRFLRDRAFMGSALAMGFAFAGMSVHSAASSFIAQDILGTGPWGFAVLYAAYAGAILIGGFVNAFIAGRVGPVLAGAGAQTVAIAAGVVLVWFAWFGPFTLATYVPTIIVGAAAASAMLSNFSSLTMARAGFAAASGAALMGALQYGLAAGLAPLGGMFGPGTAVPAAAGMLACLVIAVLCAAYAHHAARTRGDHPRISRTRAGHKRNTGATPRA
ncbi:MFS transporter [Microbacterium sp. GXF7504]